MIGNSSKQLVIDLGVQVSTLCRGRGPQTNREFFLDQVVLPDLVRRSCFNLWLAVRHLPYTQPQKPHTLDPAHRLFNPRMLRKKLEKSVWHPNVREVTAGITIRIVRAGSRLPNES